MPKLSVSCTTGNKAPKILEGSKGKQFDVWRMMFESLKSFLSTGEDSRKIKRWKKHCKCYLTELRSYCRSYS